ncbi:fimbria/pilus periplasmic chaperone [Escherichia coli]|uniref:fimbria/pilus periplasmic chaperone n=1 Tax=Escherichia coli TaxID=562 RepID=UPI002042644A|nr:fimbria/pilus periplasmic chaperone [Escherichia coli]
MILRPHLLLPPPINRVDPGKGQTLRVTFTDLPLPTDRESVFWLNVLEIPTRYEPKSNDNYLQVAFRTRIKLFTDQKIYQENLWRHRIHSSGRFLVGN